MSSSSRVVIITGCSSGIGAASAAAFAAAGWITVATARRIDTLESLKSLGCEVDTLDVTSDADRQRVVAAVIARHGRIDVLVNNAGYPEYGPFEEVSLERWRAQFDTNVFGLVAMSQLVIPVMREQHRGRIINISSIGGIITLPLGSAYHASKWAVEALSDVARFELKPFGIDVVVIEPGVTLTNFETPAQSGLSLDESSPYFSLAVKFSLMLSSNYRKKNATNVTAEQIATVIVRSAQSRHPRARYLVPASSRALTWSRPLMPDWFYDLVQGWVLR
jgi:NAD(P)-dependent dehydrogenase (short-subunit alcohol dehydrogenase family)